MGKTTGAAEPAETQTLQGSRRQRLERLWRTFHADRFASVGLSFLLLLICVALFAEVIAPHDPTRTGIGKRLRPGIWTNQTDITFPLGTDHLGRDVLSRLIYGSRISLLVSFSSVAIAGTIGTALGLLAVYGRSAIARIIMGWADLQSLFPGLLLALSILALLDTSPVHIVLVLALSNWMWYTRLTYDVVGRARASLVVEAATACGSGAGRVFLNHYVPSLTLPLIILSIQESARMLLMEASLSFLGFGAQPPTPAWGLMLAESRPYARMHGALAVSRGWLARRYQRPAAALSSGATAWLRAAQGRTTGY